MLRTMRPVTLAAIIFATSVTALAQDVRVRSDRTVSIDLTNVTLREALQAIANRTPFEKLVLDDAVAGRIVTVKLDGADVPQALAAILTAADVNYVVAGGDGRPIRLVAGRAGFVAANAKGAGRDAGQEAAPTESRADGKDAVDEATPADETRAAAGAAAFEAVVTAPVVPIRPGTRVELPFPGPDGLPLTTTMPAVRPTALPFPTIPPPRVPAPTAPARPKS